MAIRVDTSISIRSEYGVTLGRLLKVSDKQLLVSASAKFRPGSKLEFQLELPAYDATVYGLAQVTRVTAFEDASNRYLLGITQLSTKDRSLYQQWIYELAQVGGDSHRSSAMVSSIVSTLGERHAPPSKPAAPAAASALRKGPELQWSAASSVSTSRQHVGRAAVREALRARFAGRDRTTKPNSGIPREQEPAPAPAGRYGLDASTLSQARGVTAPPDGPRNPRPARSPDAAAEFSSTIQRARGMRSRTAGGGDITITHSPEAEQQFSSRQTPPPSSVLAPSATPGKPAPARRLEVQLALSKSPPLVSLRYRDITRYLSDYSDYLAKNAAFVRWSGTKPGHRVEVAVELMLPSDARISCSGQVVAIMPSGFGLSLQLTDHDREALAKEARLDL